MLLLVFHAITELVEIIGICVINIAQVLAKVFDVPIKEINKIVSLVLCELFESCHDVIPILLVPDNVNELINDVIMRYDIWNQEFELYNFSLFVLFLILHDLDFFRLLDHITILEN